MNRPNRILTLIFALFMAFGLSACEGEKPKDKPKEETSKPKPTEKADAASEKPEEKADAASEKPEEKADAASEKPEEKADATAENSDAAAEQPPEAVPAADGEYLRFKVGHVGKPEDVAVGNMKFSLVKAKIDFNDLTNAENVAEFDVDLSTINTANPTRDTHLKSPDFFDVAKFARAKFTIKDVKAGEGEGAFTATAALDIHGVQKDVPVSFKVVEKTDTSVTIEGSAKLVRSEFGVGQPPAEKGPLDETIIEIRTTLENK